MSFSTYLVTPKELNEALQQDDPRSRIVPLCASWFLPNDPERRTGVDTFRKARVPGARFFDLDAVKDHESPYPHMLPPASEFESAMSTLGIKNSDTCVVYDAAETGIFSAPRVAWTLREYGHQRVHILNNFRIWLQEGYPTHSGHTHPAEQTVYTVPSDVQVAKHSVDFERVKRWTLAQESGDEEARNTIMLDARPKGRFDGKDPEPRPGLPSGHVPGSVSLPFTAVLEPDTKAFLPKDELRKIFEEKGVDGGRDVISACGTGVTAAVLDTALEVCGTADNRVLYDGSWTEWAQRATKDEGLIVDS